MANILSKNLQQIIIKAILGLIALVFVFWGFGGYNTRKSVLVATVNGVDIFRLELEKAYERLLVNYKKQMAQFDTDVSNKLLQQLNLKQKALDDIVKMILLEQEAKRLNLTVSSQEIKDAIKNYPEFQHEGRFNIEQYRYVLKQNRILPADFEQNRRDMLILSKIENIVTDSVQVSEDETLNEYKRRNEKVTIDFIAFNPVDLKAEATVTDQSIKSYFAGKYTTIKEYFDANASGFDIPEKVRVEVLAFENDEYANRVKIEPAEIQAYYDNNSAEYTLEEEAKVSHILIKSEIGDDPSLRGDAEKRAQDILDKLNTGEGFETLSKKYSEDKDTAETGGNLGWMTRGDDAYSVARESAKLKVGEVSEVVSLQDGYHIIKVVDRKQERKQELDKVKDGIVQMLSLEKGKELIEDLTRQARKDVFRSRDVVSYAKSNNVKLITPPPFALSDKIEGIGKHSAFNRSVFEVDEGDVSDIIELAAGSYIVKVAEKIPARTPDFAEVKDAVIEEIKGGMVKEIADKKAEEALNKLRDGVALKDIAKYHKLELQSTPPFPRQGALAPKIGVSEGLVNTAFGLSKDNPYPDKIFTVNNKRHLIQFTGREEISEEEFKKERPLLLKQLRMEKANKVFESYVQGLHDSADIEMFAEM